MSDKRAAATMVSRLAQIDAITSLLIVKIEQKLKRFPGSDGYAELIESIENLLIDEKLATRAELQRYVVAAQARVDQEVAARKDPPSFLETPQQ